MKTTDLPFAAAVRKMRIARGLTQGQLADAAGVSRPYLIRIEAGHWPRPKTYNRLLRAFDFVRGDEFMAAAREKLTRSPRTADARCESCGTRISPPGARRGRPRKRCA